MKTYMVVERFHDGCYEQVYERFSQQGRLLPDGLHYLDSWSNREHNLCFQLMQTADPGLLAQWFAHWQDLVDFEFYPVDQPTSPTIPPSSKSSSL